MAFDDEIDIGCGGSSQMYGESHDEQEEHFVIFLPNAVVEPYAVMIELRSAPVASPTMLGGLIDV